jgi:hypothetical protein
MSIDNFGITEVDVHEFLPPPQKKNPHSIGLRGNQRSLG